MLSVGFLKTNEKRKAFSKEFVKGETIPSYRSSSRYINAIQPPSPFLYQAGANAIVTCDCTEEGIRSGGLDMTQSLAKGKWENV